MKASSRQYEQKAGQVNISKGHIHWTLFCHAYALKHRFTLTLQVSKLSRRSWGIYIQTRGMQTVARGPKIDREWKFCGPRKGPYFERALPIFRGWPASCLPRRAWHMQLWPVDQSGYVYLARQRCMVAHPWCRQWYDNRYLPSVWRTAQLCWQPISATNLKKRCQLIALNTNIFTLTKRLTASVMFDESRNTGEDL